ncbi:MAG: heme-degrading monooxygenase HmoA [Candidatus Azotimanducaceae bacterium]
MAYLSYIRFDVKDGKRSAFLDAFDKTGMLTRPKSIPGFKWGRLAESFSRSSGRSINGSMDKPSDQQQAHFIVVAEWASESDYVQWQSVAMPSLSKDLVREFLDCLDEPAPGKLYEIRASSHQ